MGMKRRRMAGLFALIAVLVTISTNVHADHDLGLDVSLISLGKSGDKSALSGGAQEASSMRRRKKPKVYESEKVLIHTGGPRPGVTRREFDASCDPQPVTQGVDAHVFEVPNRYQGYRWAILEWSGQVEAGLDYELHPYVYNGSCDRGRQYFGFHLDAQQGPWPGFGRFVVLESRQPPPVTAWVRIRPMTNSEKQLYGPQSKRKTRNN